MKPFSFPQMRVVSTCLVLGACVGELGDPVSGNVTGSDSPNPDESGLAVGPSEVSRLTRVEYERTVRSIFGESTIAGVRFDRLPADGKSGQFESNSVLAMNVDAADGYRLVAEDIGERAGKQAAELLPCGESDSCVQEFIDSMGAKMYRRPIRSEEQLQYRDLWTQFRLTSSFQDALRLLVTTWLQSPSFLYRWEAGEEVDAEPGVRKLTGYEVASRLSYFLWRTIPDGELLEAAERGDLSAAEGIEVQARRMLADPRADYALLQFHTDWLGIAELENHEVAPEFAPAFEGIRDDMMQETKDFIVHVFRNDDATLQTLLTADYSFASPELAAFYDEGAAPDADGRFSLHAERRSGILTHASFLTAQAHNPQRAAIYRGSTIRAQMLCQTYVLPDDVMPAPFDANATSRKQVEQMTSGAQCAACHSRINPLGFAFEHFDAIGRWRDLDKDQPIDASGEVVSTDVDGAFSGATELVAKLAKSKEVEACVSRQWLRYALSRVDDARDRRSFEGASMQAAGDMRELLVALAQTDAFRYRRLRE